MILLIVITSILLAAVFFIGSLRPQFLATFIKRVPTNKKVVALTFDDGPHPRYTKEILKVLKENNVPATFFMLGEQVAKFPESFKAVLKDKHEIGNHSWSHPILPFKGPQYIKREIRNTDKAIKKAGYKKPTLFRAPKGMQSIFLDRILKKLSKTQILWDVHTWDWTAIGPKQIIKLVMQQTKPGSIILLHDGIPGRAKTIEAIKEIIPTLKKQGYTFVTVSELLTY